MSNTLFYGDNLEILRDKIKDETVDLCYIDPPFNSNRDYFQIYNNIGQEDRAQAQAFTDTWTWDMHAIEGLNDIFFNSKGSFPAQTIELLRGLKAVLGEGALLAYLVSMTQRINEIHRVLKPTGSFYLHCDPTASHYLKLVLDTIFVTQGGDFRNEIIWCYRKWSVQQNQFASNHDTIFFYTKSKGKNEKFNTLFVPLSEGTMKRWKGKKQQAFFEEGVRKASSEENESQGSPMADWWEVSIINPAANERLGYPTQKPEALLERIIAASSNEGDVVLDAYCGCGTTIAVAQRLKRQWIGIDITYQSIGVILKRLLETYGEAVGQETVLSGIPRDIAAAKALATKKDDRVRKEFEKWAVLTYSRHQAIINAKKGADAGIDGVQYFPSGVNSDDVGKVVFQVKSGKVERSDIAKLRGDMARENAKMAVFLTLEAPTAPMKSEALSAGMWNYPLMARDYPQIQIVTVEEMLRGAKLDLPLVHQSLKKSSAKFADEQTSLDLSGE